MLNCFCSDDTSSSPLPPPPYFQDLPTSSTLGGVKLPLPLHLYLLKSEPSFKPVPKAGNKIKRQPLLSCMHGEVYMLQG